jgi:hypothetical protein
MTEILFLGALRVSAVNTLVHFVPKAANIISPQGLRVRRVRRAGARGEVAT